MPEMPRFMSARGSTTDRRRVYDRERRDNRPWRGWYKLAAWLRRREHQLREKPLCERCAREGIVTAATVANHIEPHRGDWGKFINGRLESTCKPCHDSVIQSEERATKS
jgi:5-methylcytosine-specific restriction protein A